MRCVFRLSIGLKFRIVKRALKCDHEKLPQSWGQSKEDVCGYQEQVFQTGIERMGWWLILFSGSGIKGQAMVMKGSEFRTDKTNT